MREDWNVRVCVFASSAGVNETCREQLKKGDFILHLPFWNSFPWEVNGFPELQNIKESETVYCF
jgi:hypothetical protein